VHEVRAFHLNDAKAHRGSHLDRHENIGKGEIGAAGFAPLLRDPRWNDRPGYLETPLDENDYARYVEDLATLRAVAGEAAPAPVPSPSAPAATRRRGTRRSD
jgi:deoxyribonuclease IV